MARQRTWICPTCRHGNESAAKTCEACGAPTTMAPEFLVLASGSGTLQVQAGDTLQLRDSTLAPFLRDRKATLGTIGRIYCDGSLGWVVLFTQHARYRYPRLDGAEAPPNTVIPLKEGMRLTLAGLEDLVVRMR